ncbi:MAG: hypothetical protein ACYCXR_05620 [Coriobacteriia bacterium]
MMAHAPRELISTLFRAWRRLLTMALHGINQVWARLRLVGARRGDEWLTVRDYLTDTAAVWADGSLARLTPAAAFGLRALAAGLIVSTGMALGAGSSAPAAGLIVLTELLWAAIRLAIVLLVLPADTHRPRTLLAFAAGLAPYAVGITPLMRLVSLLLSGVLTARGLRGAGVATGHARTAIVWAFGGQIVVVVIGALIRGAVALLGAF